MALTKFEYTCSKRYKSSIVATVCMLFKCSLVFMLVCWHRLTAFVLTVIVWNKRSASVRVNVHWTWTSAVMTSFRQMRGWPGLFSTQHYLSAKTCLFWMQPLRCACYIFAITLCMHVEISLVYTIICYYLLLWLLLSLYSAMNLLH